MSDWEIWAPTQAQLVTVAKQVVANKNVNLTSITNSDGIMIEGFLNNGTRICINYYKIKMMPTGNTVVTALGSGPEMARVAGFFAIMRWLPPDGITLPPQPSVASGVTLVPLPADSPIKFAGS